MCMQSKFGAVLRLIAVDTIGSIVWFPFWWYTTGLARVLAYMFHAIRFRAQSYSLGIWMRHFFVPMYGQYDITGRVVSVFMRLAVFCGRVCALVAEAMFYAALVLCWSLAPVTLFFLIFQGIVRNSFI